MRVRVVTGIVVVLIAALAFVAWRRSTAPAIPPESAASGTEQGGTGLGGGMVGPPAADPGVAWQTPARWEEEPASGMRLANYAIPAPASGDERARCAVYYFGPGQGGETGANIERWIGEFENPSKPAQRTFEVRGMKVTRVEVAGSYLAHAGMSEGGAESPAPGWMLLGAIVEGPNGALFFKLTGPSATVSPAAREFDGLLASIRKKSSA